MLKYRINTNKFNKTKVSLPVDTIEFVDFMDIEGYDGINKDRIMLLCECNDIDKLKRGDIINSINTLYMNYGDIYTFNNEHVISGINKEQRSFAFFIDRYISLNVKNISSIKYDVAPEGIDIAENDNIFLYLNENHCFDETDEIIVYFRFSNNNGVFSIKSIPFRFYSYDTLVTSYDDFDNELYKLIFRTEKPTNEENVEEIIGDLSGIELLRDNYLFGEKSNYEFWFERAIIDINIPISNTFETNLTQMELLNEYFVEDEKKKAINKITDIEKDVYYPSIYTYNNGNYIFDSDIYTIKFNLHFREHRGENWLVDNNSYWNGVNKDGTINNNITQDNSSDLLTFLDFTNDDVHYQKNKLKKSFLRLSFYDSTNPANQNMLGYSTIFLDSGDLFAKYVRYMEEKDYKLIGHDKNDYGIYNVQNNKVGIRVDREHGFEEEKRLSSQFVVKSKNTSTASSEGFYLYIWKDNESTLPQDIYMKVEFNHAGYGRTIPFMMPFYDTNKHVGKEPHFKTFKEIIEDFQNENGDKTKDEPYGMRQYVKYSYLHLKYCYDKNNMMHRYFIDPKIYGKQENNNHEIVINLYEAKIGGGK